MEIEYHNMNDLYKYKYQFISIVTRDYYPSIMKNCIGIVSGTFVGIYDDSSGYFMIIGCAKLYFVAIKKIFTDIQEAIAYSEYLNGN